VRKLFARRRYLLCPKGKNQVKDFFRSAPAIAVKRLKLGLSMALQESIYFK
jgi:hypothetical protein